jgi:hypothetical protein
MTAKAESTVRERPRTGKRLTPADGGYADQN